MKTIKLLTLFLILSACTLFNSCKDDDPDFTLVGNAWTGSAKSGYYIYEYTYIFLKDNVGTSIVKRNNGSGENKEAFNYVLNLEKSQLALYYPGRGSQKGEIYDIAIISDEIIILSGNVGENQSITPTLSLTRSKVKK